MDEQLKSNLTSPKHWVRLVYMVLFAFFLYVAAMVMVGLVVVQFIFALLTGSDNHKLRAFGYTLTRYIQQALMFLSFNSEFKPFPFADWPDEPVFADPAITEPTIIEPEGPVAAEVSPAPGPATGGAEAAVPREPDGAEISKDVDAQKDERPLERPDQCGTGAEDRDPPLVDPEAEKRILS